MLCLLMEILSHASVKKKAKRLKRFKFCTFMGRFQATSWQVKELAISISQNMFCQSRPTFLHPVKAFRILKNYWFYLSLKIQLASITVSLNFVFSNASISRKFLVFMAILTRINLKHPQKAPHPPPFFFGGGGGGKRCMDCLSLKQIYLFIVFIVLAP